MVLSCDVNKVCGVKILFQRKHYLPKALLFLPSCRPPTNTPWLLFLRVGPTYIRSRIVARSPAYSLTPYTLWFGFVVSSTHTFDRSLLTFGAGFAHTLDCSNGSRFSLHSSIFLLIVRTALVLQVQPTRSFCSSDCFPAASPAYTICLSSAIQLLSCCINR